MKADRFETKKNPMTRSWMVWGLALLIMAVSLPMAQAKSYAEVGRYTFADLAEKVGPSVVTVYLNKQLSKEDLDEFKKMLRIPEGIGPTPEDMQVGSGSGVIINDEGYILTNQHVVAQADEKTEIAVVFSDDTEISGDDVQLIYEHSLTDLAMLKIKPEALKRIGKDAMKPVEWGSSDDLRIGEMVAAVGSPLGLRQTITAGIICSKHRNVGNWGLGDLIQTDAVINPGSSGGVLVNLEGELIGINRLITTGTGTWQGFGFAIPSEDAHRFAMDVIEKGKISYGYIGITMQNSEALKPVARQGMGLQGDAKGVTVINVAEDKPAAQAGIAVGDFIVQIDDLPIETSIDILQYVARKRVGDEIAVKVLRSDAAGRSEEKTLDLVIGERPPEEEMTEMAKAREVTQPDEKTLANSITVEDLGIELVVIDYNGKPAMYVKALDSRGTAARAGLLPGDVIVSINHQALTSARDINYALGRRKTLPHLSVVVREGRSWMVGIPQN